MRHCINFAKMHGAGNDFIMIDQRKLGGAQLDAKRIAWMCDRRIGVGADGLIILGPASSQGADFRMSYWNADGGEAEMCGNGARCSVSFAHEIGLMGETCRFDTRAGILDGLWHAHDDVEVTLTPWSGLELDVDLGDTPWPAHHFCNTGVPHLVIPVDNLEDVPLEEWGPRLRRHARFAPRGTNVNWVSVGPGGQLFMRTYERGVEAETLACGTGASAVAVVMCRLGLATSPISLRTRGGDVLIVSIDMEENTLRLRGPAVTSFHGEVWIDES